MNPKPLQVTTPTDTTISLTRTFNAPRRLVWEAMTTPDKMRRWMLPPPGWTTTICECDARTGGALRLVWKSADEDPAMTLYGVFTEAVSPQRMVHTEMMVTAAGVVVGSLVEVHEFEETNGITTMRITQSYPSKDARDGGFGGGMMEEGMEACYKQLDALFA